MSTQSIPKMSSLPVNTDLPEVIAHYIGAANEGRIADAAACFAEGALVQDENCDHQGIEAVRKWIADTTQEFQPRNEVVSAKAEGGVYAVFSKISGNFPGSPTELEFRFVIANEKITRLNIQ